MNCDVRVVVHVVGILNSLRLYNCQLPNIYSVLSSFNKTTSSTLISSLSVNGTLSVLLCSLFRFHKEAVHALRLEFSRFCTIGIREFLCKNGCKVSKEK